MGIHRLFDQIDSDQSGTITIGELEHHLQNKAVQAFFQALGIEPYDAWTLFKLMDENDSHNIDIEKFVVGCLKLNGNAKSTELLKLAYDNKWIAKKLLQLRPRNATATGLGKNCGRMFQN